jgi:glycosyltransferase involved in cell wall biosynthesis
MISVCFITKDEEQWLAGCIDQLRGFVSEIIVVDTGSTDRTVEIAKAKGAKVFDFKWTGSFADARNFSLSKATQPWILKVDPDEKINTADLEKLIAFTNSDVDAVRCTTRTYTNVQGAVSEDSFKPCRGEFPERERGYHGYKEIMYTRLFRNIPGVRYTGLIHEDIEPSIRAISKNPAPIYWADEIIFHNYGMNGTIVSQKAKLNNYRDLMEKEVVANPENWFVWYELANHYYQAGEYERASETFRKAYDLDNNQLPTMINLGHVLTLIGQREEGEKFLRMALNKDPNNHNTWLNFAVSRSDAMDFNFAQECFQKAILLNPESLATWRAFGQCLAKKGDLINSEAAFKSALQRLPTFTDAKIDLAIVVASQGRKNESVDLLKESLGEDPGNERAKFFLQQVETTNPQ